MPPLGATLQRYPSMLPYALCINTTRNCSRYIPSYWDTKQSTETEKFKYGPRLIVEVPEVNYMDYHPLFTLRIHPKSCTHRTPMVNQSGFV